MEDMEKTVAEIGLWGGKPWLFGDVGALKSRLRWKNHRDFGHIDILVMRGHRRHCAFHELTEEEWDTMLDINLKGSGTAARLLSRT